MLEVLSAEQKLLLLGFLLVGGFFGIAWGEKIKVKNICASLGLSLLTSIVTISILRGID